VEGATNLREVAADKEDAADVAAKVTAVTIAVV
jgi:hypothetical protein